MNSFFLEVEHLTVVMLVLAAVCLRANVHIRHAQSSASSLSVRALALATNSYSTLDYKLHTCIW
jgi:hypothetical protein